MRNVYLVGFMGTGKTETAKLLAKRLKMVPLDMDETIVSREGMPIARIFETKGEAYFRNLEKGIVEELCRKEGLVVACGGGVFADPENIARLKSSGTVICLTSTPETILRRTKGSGLRPLLNVENPKARIEELLAKRMPSYRQSHHVIDADQLTVRETADAVAEVLKSA